MRIRMIVPSPSLGITWNSSERTTRKPTLASTSRPTRARGGENTTRAGVTVNTWSLEAVVTAVNSQRTSPCGTIKGRRETGTAVPGCKLPTRVTHRQRLVWRVIDASVARQPTRRCVPDSNLQEREPNRRSNRRARANMREIDETGYLMYVGLIAKPAIVCTGRISGSMFRNLESPW